jgi:hypothetical protein
MTGEGTPNLYEQLCVAPDCPDPELYAALDRAARLDPVPHWLRHAESVLRDPRRRGYYNTHNDLPPAPGRPGKTVQGARLPMPGKQLAPHQPAVIAPRGPAGVEVHRSPAAGLLEVEWPLTVPLPGGEVLRPPFPFVDLCHSDAVGGIEPEWVPPGLLAVREARVPGRTLLALLFPLRADAQEASSPDVQVQVIACDEPGLFGGTARSDSLIREMLATAGAARATASDQRMTRNRQQAHRELYQCTGRYRACGFIRIRVPPQSIVAFFASTDEAYDYAIHELFIAL